MTINKNQPSTLKVQTLLQYYNTYKVTRMPWYYNGTRRTL